MILTADWHLTDNPADEYRWGVFEAVHKLLPSSGPVYILGDLTDRKDRHSAELVNRLVTELSKLRDRGTDVWILMGNHDKPINGTPFWQFLNLIAHPGSDDPTVHFITKPHALQDLLLLPFSANPLEEWKGIPFTRYKAAFMHQTVSGAIGNNGHALDGNNMPLFPRGMKLYSGDIHTPQIASRVTYVGAPHPVAFGDDYPCRMLLLDDSYTIRDEITLTPPKKLMLRVTSMDELARANTLAGDQARVIFQLPLNELEQWSALEEEIAHWARIRRVELASCEPEIVGLNSALSTEDEDEQQELDPVSVLRMFAEAEGIDGTMLDAGIALVEENR